MAFRSTRRHEPNAGDTLVSSPEQARKIIANLDSKLAGKISGHERATYLCARAVLYEALGDPQMLEAAQEAYKFSKTAQSATLVAVALHHFGRIREAIQYYEQSYRYPHEQGFEVDIGHQGALLFQGTAESWLKAWEITLSLKKRIVYAAHLPTWDGKPTKELQVISEGGFGDLIINSRYLPLLAARGAEKVTVFLPPYFFDSGFADLMRQQSWCPEIKYLTDAKPGIPSAGFFDLPAVFKTIPTAIPTATEWKAEPWKDSAIAYSLCANLQPKIGICFAGRAMETPLCRENVYRSISREKAEQIVQKVNGVRWVNLQKGETLAGAQNPELKSWGDTAAIIPKLDAVLSVDTAIFHLAASMGKPTYLLLSGAVDWKFGLSDPCPWYPEVKIFRNHGWGFENAIESVIATLNEGNL